MKSNAALRVLMVVMTLLMSTGLAISEDYPKKPVRIMVGASPGWGVDLMARYLAGSLAKSFGQPFIVENRASVPVAADAVAKASPDGYTLLFSTATYLTNRALFKNLPYDPQRDLATISLIGSTPIVIIANANLPASSVKDLIALANQKPGALNFASGGNGSPLHLAGELFKQRAKVDLVHVPYKGSAPAATGLITGESQLMFVSYISLASHIKSGKAKALAVMSPRRSQSLPDVPTTAEAGFPDLTASIWYGFLATANTPKAIISQLHQGVIKAMKTKEFTDSMLSQDVEPIGISPEELSAFTSAELSKWSTVIRTANIKVE